MRLTSFKRVLATGVFLSSALIATGAMAQADLDKAIANPGEWAAPGRTFDLQRYSPLDQINAGNVGKLQVAWTFSTGVLRGHEGAPLVIGDTMYVHTPFPNIVYALDLNNDGSDPLEIRAEAGSERHPGDVLRHRQSRPRLRRRQGLPAPGRHHAGRARRQDRQGRVVGQDRRSEQGRDRHRCAVRDARTRSMSASPAASSACAAGVAAYAIKDGKEVWRAYSMGPDDDMLVDPKKTTDLGKPIGKNSVAEDLERRPVEDRRRHHLGLVLL